MTRDQELKKDAGKLMLDLFPPEAIEAVTHVLMYGLEKYRKRDGWRKVEADRYRDAMLRHDHAIRMGEEIDQESGLPHSWHRLTNDVFLVCLNYLNDKEVIRCNKR